MTDLLAEKTSTRATAPPRLSRALAGLRWRRYLTPGESAAAVSVVYAGTVAYAALFVFAAVLHYAVYQTAHDDLGNMVQAIWNTLHGHFLETTTLDGHQNSRLGFHVDPFLILLAPLFWLWSSPVLLLVTQALAVATGALPVFWLARKHLGSSRAGAHFAFAYLLYPATQFNASTPSAGFHAVSFAVPLVLYAIWLLDEDRPLAFALVALLAALTKEEMPLAVGCLGIWYALRKGRRLFGFSVFTVALAVTLFDFLWLIPHYSPSGEDPYVGRYRAVGGTPQGIAHKLLSDPLAFVHATTSGHKLTYVALMFLPLLGLWIFEPLLLLGALPDLAINLLSNDGNQTSLQFQYTAGIVPFLVAASVLGAARFKRQGASLSLWVLAAVAAVAVYSPIYFAKADVQMLRSSVTSTKAHALRLIPGGVAVSASNQLGGHLSGRRYIYFFPKVRRADWIIVDINDPTYGPRTGFKRAAREYEADKEWRTVFSADGVTVLHKHPAAKR